MFKIKKKNVITKDKKILNQFNYNYYSLLNILFIGSNFVLDYSLITFNKLNI